MMLYIYIYMCSPELNGDAIDADWVRVRTYLFVSSTCGIDCCRKNYLFFLKEET